MIKLLYIQECLYLTNRQAMIIHTFSVVHDFLMLNKKFDILKNMGSQTVDGPL